MYRATTPTHSFIFDIDPDETFRTILITYAQEGDIVTFSVVEVTTWGGA